MVFRFVLMAQLSQSSGSCLHPRQGALDTRSSFVIAAVRELRLAITTTCTEGTATAAASSGIGGPSAIRWQRLRAGIPGYKKRRAHSFSSCSRRWRPTGVGIRTAAGIQRVWLVSTTLRSINTAVPGDQYFYSFKLSLELCIMKCIFHHDRTTNGAI